MKDKTIYWDNGKAVTYIEDTGACDLADCDSGLWSFSPCGLKNYNGLAVGTTAKNVEDVFKKIKDYLEVIPDKIPKGRELVNFIKNAKFKEGFYILPVSAYIHSGIALSLASFNDHFDSGFAGFIWSARLSSEEELKSCFEEFDAYVEYKIHDFEITTFKEIEGKWIVVDQYWQQAETIQEIEKMGLGFNPKDIVDKPADSLYNEIRNREITDEEIEKYLGGLSWN